MIELSEGKLGLVRKYWRELTIITMAAAIYGLFLKYVGVRDQMDKWKSEELARSQKETKFWRDAFIITAEGMKYSQQLRDSIKQ